MKKTLVIFANSVKHGKHCVAGKDLQTGHWIRPVQSADGRELPRAQVNYHNPYGSFIVKPLQKIEMELKEHAPLPYQPENYVVSPDYKWQQRYSITRDELVCYLDEPASIWPLNSSSSQGQNDRVPFQAIASGTVTIGQSLFLIIPDQLSIVIVINEMGQKRMRAQFIYNKVSYTLAITDPAVWKNFGDKPPGLYRIDPVPALCLSLGEPFNGFCYKLVVAVL